MKKFILVFILTGFLMGCGTIISDNKNDAQKKIAKKTESINLTKENLAKNTDEKLNQVSGLSFGVGYTLSSIRLTNVVEIETAKQLNNRIISIVGSPDLDEMNKIKQTVDLLNSEVEKERARGARLLAAKDNEILTIQKQRDDLEKELQKRIDEFTTTAKKQAEDSDNNSVILENINKWFGLGAVYYGLKRFATTCILGILIFAVVFLILRLLAAANPIVAAIFSVFNIVGAAIVQLVRALVPKSIDVSGFSPSTEVKKYKSTLEKLVDNIQEVKVLVKNGSSITFDKLIEKFDRDLDQSDKDLITEIKKELRWKR
jgi:bacterioferritin (cytochrome b1)